MATTTERQKIEAALENLREQILVCTDAEQAQVYADRLAKLSRAYRRRYNIGLPTNPLDQALEIDSTYRERPHLRYISDRVAQAVADAEQGESRKLYVSVPPRQGKSLLLSIYTPLWMLRKHPEWHYMMLSSDKALASNWAGTIRRTIEERPDLGIRIAPDAGAKAAWETEDGGSFFAASVKGNVVGKPAGVLILDDLVKGAQDAASPTLRDLLWNSWMQDVYPRQQPPGIVLAVGCLTADAPVLMADGTQRRIEHVRPGELVASYNAAGQIVCMPVVDMIPQGPDNIFTITMEDGRTVRANARHPFLVRSEDGEEEWKSVASMTPGESIVTLDPASLAALSKIAADRRAHEACATRTADDSRSTGRPTNSLTAIASTAPTPSAPILAAKSLPGPRGDASSTTTNTASPPAKPSGAEQPRTGRQPSGISTDSRRESTHECLTPRETAAASAESPRQMLRSVTAGGAQDSTLTTATQRELSAACCVTHVTFSSPSTPLPTFCVEHSLTSRTTASRIVSILPSGSEEVFDLQIFGTENFIANGLVSHNTRWHMNDFASRLMSREYAGDPDEWEFINIPAFAVEGDPLGREVGEPLLSPLYEETKEEAAERLRKILRDIGSYSFSALYQGTPIPDDGAIFDPAWFRFWTNDPAHVGDDGRTVLVEDGDLDGATWFTSWDLSFEDTGDYTVGQRWAVGDRGAFLVDQTRGKWAFTDQIRQMIAFTSDARTYNHLVERAANGAAALDLLKDQVSGLHPISATRNKSLRGRAVAPQFEAGTVFFPHPLMPGCSWVPALIKEVTEFDKGSHDDQVDAMTMALTWARRTSQRASLTVASGTLPQRGEGSRGAAAAAPSLLRGPLALPSRGMVRATPGTLR